MSSARHVPVAPVIDPASGFAFLLGVLFNQRMRADDAWRAPWELGHRLGGLSTARILALTPTAFAGLFAQPPAIHPFKKVMAEHSYRIAERVDGEYGGDVRRLWENATATDFLNRMQVFPGIGAHKATVALFIATRELGIAIRGDGRRYSIATCTSLAERYHPQHEPLLA